MRFIHRITRDITLGGQLKEQRAKMQSRTHQAQECTGRSGVGTVRCVRTVGQRATTPTFVAGHCLPCGQLRESGDHMSRTEVYLTAINFLQSGRSIRISGERLSGRTYLLGKIREYFETLGWRTLSVSGVEAFRNAPLASLAVSGLAPFEPGVGSTLTAIKSLTRQVSLHRTVILVDDVEWVDDASWGVIGAVSAQHDIPIAIAQSGHHHATMPVATGGLSPMYALRLPAMSYSEMEVAVEAATLQKIDPSTMSRIFSKSGGNAGFALAIVDAAIRSGRLAPDGGALRATESLWSFGLSAIAEDILRAIGNEETAALRTLALLGPADIGTAQGLLPDGMISELERKLFVEIVETSAGRLVTVQPPLVAEYFRHESLPGQRAATLNHIDSALAGASRDSGPLSDITDASAMFVRLSHERTRRHTLNAREKWRVAPSLASATHLLSALGADSGHSIDEVSTLIEAGSRMHGSSRDSAAWELAHANFVANSEARWADAVAHLREAAAVNPDMERWLLNEAAILEMQFGHVPLADPTEALTLHALDEKARDSAVVARGYWLIARGRMAAAYELLSEYSASEAFDPRAHSALVYSAIGLGRFTEALRLAEAERALARADFDAPRLWRSSYLSALAALFVRRFDVAEEALAEAHSLGVPVGQSLLVHVGIHVLGGYFAVKRGQRAELTAHLSRIGATGMPDGALPGVNTSLVNIRVALADGDVVAAGQAARRSGDELWERGVLFGAAYAYLDGLFAHPDLDDWHHAHERIREVDSPAIARWADFVEAMVKNDSRALIDAVRAVAMTGEKAEAADLASIALNHLGGDERLSVVAQRELEAMATTGRRPAPAADIELSSRELEVAELIASGLTNPQIADALVVSIRTIESHVNKLMRKIGGQVRSDIRDYLIATQAF